MQSIFSYLNIVFIIVLKFFSAFINFGCSI